MLKRKIPLLLAIVLLATSFGAFGETGEAELKQSLQKKTFPYLYCYEEGSEASGEMNLYFADGKDVPYVALTEFIPVLAEMLDTHLKCDEDHQISFEIQYADQEDGDSIFVVSRPDNGSALIIRPKDDTMTFTNYNSFFLRPGTSALVTMMDIPDPERSLDFSDIVIEIMRAQRDNEDISSLLMLTLGSNAAEDPAAQHSLFVATSKIFNRRGQPLTMRLGDYRIEILCEDGECYLPLQTVSDVFFSLRYINCVFNGEKVIADVYRGELMKRAYEAVPEDMSRELAMFNYSELCFYLDNFYGLKQEHRIDSFADFFAADTAKYPQISGTDPISFDCALTEILLSFFDDSHSGIVRYSWRSGQPEGAEMLGQMASIGYSTQTRTRIGSKLSDARNKAYPEGVPGYEEIGDTAFITFDSFTAKRAHEEYYELEDPDHPQDTIELIMYANRQVRREGSPIKNIVIDLSNNGGGNSDAAIAVACWFTGETRVSLLDTMTGAETIASYRTDLNVNGFVLSNPDGGREEYDPGDTVSGQYDLYGLISPKSFSCGNLVPAIFDQAGGITLIGQRSGGGSNAVLPSSTASGTLFQISGPLQITTYTNGSLYGIDQGVEPHVRLNRNESFYDREMLVEMIHSMK